MLDTLMLEDWNRLRLFLRYLADPEIGLPEKIRLRALELLALFEK